MPGTLHGGGDSHLRLSRRILGTDGGGPYFGFSDMGLIQLIVRGNIYVHPRVNRIDAALIAYPVRDPDNPSLIRRGTINLCAGPSDPLGREPTLATQANTKASEVVVLMPHYHFVTPAASVFDDWVKGPQAIFDIPASL